MPTKKTAANRSKRVTTFEIFKWPETPFRWCWALYHDTKRGKTCIHLECRFDSKEEARADLRAFRKLVSSAKVTLRKPRVKLEPASVGKKTRTGLFR